ncbi:methyl-accepting chemotaxis protein [Thiobacillus thioparus]|uniref:methyl-accepting chemotaxis protein n=1 Tax=Thiobacillus thioparus TaxID=931 RepID=UPI0003782FDF|nr:methyl-accepting chemotaxis protein [Thiobacillus thioparus]
MIGFWVMAAVVGVLGASAIWSLQNRAAALQHSSMVGVSGTASGSEAEWVIGLITCAGVGFALLAGWAIRRSIKDSVESTVQCVARVAGGDLETAISSPGKDEISWLRSELNSMRKKLRAMVLEVRQTVEGVNSASEEIASGNTDLSSRTESQASALQQTSSSMQLLAGTVRSNSQSTQEARDVVAQSSKVALLGSQTMQDVVVQMTEIHDGAARIGEIVGVIDSIAFQTNILALNAAVEAARAGDSGRGFAVVASEVRALAQSSSSAAREIKALIDASTERVETGSKLVHDAKRTMQEIFESVERMSELIVNIADAGQSQNNDIGQMNQAISQLDTMTQQNASLVVQLSAAAQSLKAQSGQLSSSMAAFRVAA